jgi:hypothetical protein
MGDSAFAHGALNVALSRVRRLEDLFIVGVDHLGRVAIQANDDIQAAAARLWDRAMNENPADFDGDVDHYSDSAHQEMKDEFYPPGGGPSKIPRDDLQDG